MNQTQRLVNNLLTDRVGLPLADYLADSREAGLSFERIAKDLHVKTDGIVDVTWQTVSRWCKELVS